MNRGYWISLVQVSGGVIFGQLVGIIGFLLLTRLFSPAEFGLYASWLSMVAIGSVVCTGALETSLVRESDGVARSDATGHVIWTGVLGSVLFAGFCGLVLSFFPTFLPGNRIIVAASIAIAVFGLAACVVLQSWAAAEGLFRPLTILRIAQSMLIVFIPIVFSFFGRTSDHLIWGHALGLVGSVVAWSFIARRDMFRPRSPKGLLGFWGVRNRCFIFVLPALLVGALAGNLPQLAINWRFGAEVAGHLALAQRVLGVPLSLIGIAVRDVFKRYASMAYRERHECRREFWSSFLVLGIVGICFGLVMYPLSETLFVLVFGEPWRFAGEISRWLLPMFVVGIVASPLTYIVYIVEREDFDLYWQSALLLVVGASLTAFDSNAVTLKVFAWAYAGMYAVYIFNCARFARGVRNESVQAKSSRRES